MVTNQLHTDPPSTTRRILSIKDEELFSTSKYNSTSTLGQVTWGTWVTHGLRILKDMEYCANCVTYGVTGGHTLFRNNDHGFFTCTLYKLLHVCLSFLHRSQTRSKV